MVIKPCLIKVMVLRGVRHTRVEEASSVASMGGPQVDRISSISVVNFGGPEKRVVVGLRIASALLSLSVFL